MYASPTFLAFLGQMKLPYRSLPKGKGRRRTQPSSDNTRSSGSGGDGNGVGNGTGIGAGLGLSIGMAVFHSTVHIGDGVGVWDELLAVSVKLGARPRKNHDIVTALLQPNGEFLFQ